MMTERIESCMSRWNLLTFSSLLLIIIVTTIYFQVELNSLKTRLQYDVNSMNDEIAKLHEVLNTQVNQTIKALNNTVAETHESMQEEIQTVNEDVSAQNSLLAYQFAGTFTLLGGLISMWHMTAHLRKFNEPFVQRKILAILWMCPIYSITSWLSLVFVSAEGYLAIVKDCYEAYCIYTFLAFLIAVLGRGDRNAVVDLLATHADNLSPPIQLPCFHLSYNSEYECARAKADAVLHQCQLFAMQFVLLRPLTTLAMAISNQLYTGSWTYQSPQFYIIVITNISVFVAFSGLLKFYHAVQKDLVWCRPFPKFLCIKGVVFMTFWQNMAITILAKTLWKHNFEENDDSDPEEWGTQAQNFLICLEMLFFAVVHCFVFPTEEWEEGYRPRLKKAKFGDNIAFHDFVQDVKLILRSKKSRSRDSRKDEKESDLSPTVVDESLEENGLLYDLSMRETSIEKEHDAVNIDDDGNDNAHDDENDSINWERIEKFIEETDDTITSGEIV